jgi:hypothetical protein
MRPLAPRRLVPLLAAALASGCVVQTGQDTGSVAIYWSFWSSSLGDIGDVTDSAAAVCSAAAVDGIRISLVDPGGAPLAPSDGPCASAYDVPGAAFAGLDPGTWSYVLEARRSGATAYEASGSFEVTVGERAIVDVRATPPAGRWDAIFAVTSSGCDAGDRFDFDLYDTGGVSRVKVFSTHDASVNPPVAVPCVLTGQVKVPSVAPGTYQSSDWARVDASGTTAKAYGACRPAWTQPDDGNASLSVDVTAAVPPPADNSGVCL